jgi:hypothetical protein
MVEAIYRLLLNRRRDERNKHLEYVREIEREIAYIDQQLRIFETLKNERDENEKNNVKR